MVKFIDLFAGIGGIRLAFEVNGAECVMSSEIDKYAAETYSMNFGEIPRGDITKIDIESIPEFDVVVGGFPCQPFSIGGLRKGFEDTRGTLFFEIEKIIKEKQPKAFFLENVAGLVSHDGGKTLEVIEKHLSELGYTFKWKVMNAFNYGVPQNRNRWYCVGFRNDLNISFEGDVSINPERVYSFPKERELVTTVNDIVRDIESDEYKISETAVYDINKFLPAYLSSTRYAENPGNLILANEIRASRCGFRSDGIAPCLTAKMGTGGNNVPVYVNQMRKLTERECLQLMGFPSTYKIAKNSAHSYKQIGNSVVVSIIQELAKEMLRVIAD